MKKYTNIITSKSGDALPGVTVKVLNQDGTTATIYSDNGTTQIPGGVVTTDGGGIFSFYAANGRYNLQISGVGINTYTLQDELLYDPHDDESSLAAKANTADLASTASGKGADLIGDSIRASSLANTANGKGADLIANAAKKLASIAALRALRAPQGSDAQTVIVDGYATAGDGGGGVFLWWPNASQADDGGIYIMPGSAPATGRWVRAGWHIFSPINILWYGADPTFTNDATAAIQKAINFGHTDVYVPDGTYMISLDGTSYPGIGAGMGLKLRSNLRLYGPGTLKLKAGSAGSSSNMLTNVNGAIDNCIIEGLTLDGNKANVAGTTACCTLFSATNSKFIRVKAINSSYVGLMMRGTASADNKCLYCTVLNPATIGIQFSAHYGALIHGNIIKGTGDNGIDIEANNATGVGKITITANQLDSIGNTGVFLESTGEAIVADNFIYNFTNYGVDMNQINTPSINNIIRGNHFYNVTQGGSGVYLNNTVGRSLVEGNFFRNLNNSILCNYGITWLHVGKNTHQAIKKYLVDISAVTNSLVKSFIDTQIYQGAQDGNGFPKLTSPINEPSNHPDRVYNVSLNGAKCLETNSNTNENFYYGSGNTTPNANWSNAYAILFNGDTHVSFGGATIPSVGDYIKINGIFYLVTAGAGNDTTVKSAAGVSGNYTSALNAAYTTYSYNPTQYAAATGD